MVTLATTERLVPPLAVPTRDARPAIAAALLHVGVAAALLLGWRHAPSEVPGSFAVSLVLEPAPAVASGAAEAVPDSPTPQTEETAEPADPAPEIAPAPVLDAEVATTEPIPPGTPPLSPELAAEPAAIEAPEPEIPVAKLAPALTPADALPPPLPAPKPTPPPAATVAERVPQRALASPPLPSAAARAAGDPRSTVDAPTPEARTATVGSSAAPPAPVLLDRPRYRERPAPPRYPMRARELEQQGLVLVRARLDTIGDPVEVEVLRSSGFHLLDEAAAEAVWKWRFVPARREGRSVEALVQIPVRFTLN